MDNSEITILNVDGSEVGLYAKSRILREAGYIVIEARTGRGAAVGVRFGSQLVLLSADLLTGAGSKRSVGSRPIRRSLRNRPRPWSCSCRPPSSAVRSGRAL